MDILASSSLAFPRAVVFATNRDRMIDLVPHLPNIRQIVLKERIERPGEVHVVSEWAGGADIPSVARAFLKPNMLSWTDIATWREEDFTVEWRTEMHAFPGALEISGKNRFLDANGQTTFELRGTITCHPEKVPGVPRFLHKTVGSAVEQTILKNITANVREIGKGLAALIQVA